jgi:hypothetical protein
MRDAARKGIKIAAIGASGLPLAGELVWRQIAQYTMSPFVKLIRLETGEVLSLSLLKVQQALLN